MELTDLEICKRIAEIEGFDFIKFENSIVKITTKKVTMNCFYKDLKDHVKVMYNKNNIYNPLTDDALCFKLMVKYKVLITWQELNNNCTAVIDGTSEDIPFAFAIADINDKNPNRAICLSIIASVDSINK